MAYPFHPPNGNFASRSIPNEPEIPDLPYFYTTTTGNTNPPTIPSTTETRGGHTTSTLWEGETGAHAPINSGASLPAPSTCVPYFSPSSGTSANDGIPCQLFGNHLYEGSALSPSEVTFRTSFPERATTTSAYERHNQGNNDGVLPSNGAEMQRSTGINSQFCSNAGRDTGSAYSAPVTPVQDQAAPFDAAAIQTFPSFSAPIRVHPVSAGYTEGRYGVDSVSRNLFCGSTTPSKSSIDCKRKKGGVKKPQIKCTSGQYKLPSNYCHICLRRNTRVKLLQCHNLKVDGSCTKSTCEKCFRTFGWDWLNASKGNSEWVCTHCRGCCPSRATCHVYNRANNRRAKRISAAKMKRLVECIKTDVNLVQRKNPCSAGPLGDRE